jgi:hypothetical protein
MHRKYYTRSRDLQFDVPLLDQDFDTLSLECDGFIAVGRRGQYQIRDVSHNIVGLNIKTDW